MIAEVFLCLITAYRGISSSDQKPKNMEFFLKKTTKDETYTYTK